MSNDKIRDIVFDVYRSELGDLPVTDDLNLFQSGIVDSFALINLVTALEKRYGLKIPDSDATSDNLGSVDLAAAYIASRHG